MRKSDIDKLARSKGNRAIAQDARKTPQERTDAQAVNLSRESADAIVGAIIERLAAMLPIYARLAAADTIHTAQEPKTVLRHAIDEGKLAAKLIKEAEA